MKTNLRLRRPTTLSLINNGRASHGHPSSGFWTPCSQLRIAGCTPAPTQGWATTRPWPALQSRFRPPLLEPQEPHQRQPGALLLLANERRGPDLWAADRGILETTGGSSGTGTRHTRSPTHHAACWPCLVSGHPPSTRVGVNTVTCLDNFKLCSQILGCNLSHSGGVFPAHHLEAQGGQTSTRSTSTCAGAVDSLLSLRNRRPIPSQSKFQQAQDGPGTQDPAQPSMRVPSRLRPLAPSLPPSVARTRVDFPPSASHLGRSLICRRQAICLFCLVSSDK